MNATNRLAPRQQTFSGAITSTTMQTMIQKSLKDDRAAARFTSTLISAVNASDQLRSMRMMKNGRKQGSSDITHILS